MATGLSRHRHGGLAALALWLLAALLTVQAATPARQLAFRRDGLTLHYRLQPPPALAAGAIQSFSLTLPAQTLLGTFRPWKPDAARRILYTRVLQAASQQWPDARLRVEPGGDWPIAIHTGDGKQLPEIRSWLDQQMQQELATLLKESYLQQASGPWGENGIRPDYARLIEESSSELGDVAEALLQLAGGEQADPRTRLQWLLLFVQTIPYQTLQSRDGLRGSGFLLPRQVLLENRGDCDSKSALLASLWRYLQPDIPSRMVLVPEHALLALALPAAPGEETLTVDGQPWLLVEPTGPAVLPVGQLGEESRLYIRTGRVQTVPTQPTDTNSMPSK